MTIMRPRIAYFNLPFNSSFSNVFSVIIYFVPDQISTNATTAPIINQIMQKMLHAKFPNASLTSFPLDIIS
ncbi:MAG: hypothetical protein DRO76_04780 [Candidatus Altiarchaeales archaeon]|nr:MAG: hypothetical protein DRO76_04780 [Candidatus Altiarchaeales archaeon]